MRVATFFRGYAFAFVVVCFSNGVPPGSDRYLYTYQEDELILKLLESLASKYSGKTWKVMEKVFNIKVQKKVPGFLKRRSADSLQQHFCNVIMKKKNMNVSDTVKQLHTKMRKPFNEEEQKLINEQLCLCQGKLYSDKTWKDIKIEHDKKRESNCPGFTSERTWISLRSHFQEKMKREGLIDDAVIQKFPDNFKTEEGTSTEGADQPDSSRSKNVSSILKDLAKSQGCTVKLLKATLQCWHCKKGEPLQWGYLPIMRSSEIPLYNGISVAELNVDDLGVDFRLFQDSVAGEDNDFFMQDPPYDIRSFEQTSP